MEIVAQVGGKPGRDCGGFCEFCYFKNLDFKELKSLRLGCRYCFSNQIGCRNCQDIINSVRVDFISPFNVLREIHAILLRNNFLGLLDNRNPRILVSSMADIIFYPYLSQLLSVLKERDMLVHLGYTSGKGIKNEEMAENILTMGVDEISFSVFSINPEKRRKWMNDKTPEESIKALKLFCENIDVNASTVVIPGVIDIDEIFQIGSKLEEWGVKTFNLSNFANYKQQGLTLNKKPIIEEITPYSHEDFLKIVKKVDNEFNFRIGGSPLYEPKRDIPFAISEIKNKKYLENLPRIKLEASIVTSKLAAFYIKKIIDVVDEENLINIVSVNKEIADLITHEDLEEINLVKLKRRIIIPGGALVHDTFTEKILSRDGTKRLIIRGPNTLTPSWDLDRKKHIYFEINAFKELIDTINSFPN